MAMRVTYTVANGEVMPDSGTALGRTMFLIHLGAQLHFWTTP